MMLRARAFVSSHLREGFKDSHNSFFESVHRMKPKVVKQKHNSSRSFSANRRCERGGDFIRESANIFLNLELNFNLFLTYFTSCLSLFCGLFNSHLARKVFRKL